MTKKKTNSHRQNKTEKDDIVFISEESDISSDFETKIKKLKDRLRGCEKEKREYLDGWQRAKADFINARQEDEKARGKIMELAKEGMLLEILPVVDSFELAFANKKAWGEVSKGWRDGVEYIYSQLIKIIKENGLESIDPEGGVFDPLLHESVESALASKESEHEKIVEVLQRGYSLNGKILRPAKVKVALYKK